MNERKIKGTWMIAVRDVAEREPTSKRSNKHQNQREGGKLKGGAR